MDDRELLFEQRLSDYNILREMYKSGQIESLNDFEMELLRFCHDTDMRQYLTEEFEKHPIKLNDDGSIDYTKTHINNEPKQQQQPNIPQIQANINQYKFYYLYDDNGNLIAAIPQR